MRYLIILMLLITQFAYLAAQTGNNPEEGNVSYVTTQNVYVKFNTTEGLADGDTLFIQKDGKYQPVLKIKDMSSVSCVCIPLDNTPLKINDKITGFKKLLKPIAETEKTPAKTAVPLVNPADSVRAKARKTGAEGKQLINGRVSVSSYSGITNTPADNSQRMRYTVLVNGRNLGGSKLSAETYISFVHSDKTWDAVKEDIFNGLKIYNLALRYDVSKDFKLTLGRKINPRISNMGAIDGFQAEKRFGAMTYGLVTGFRPDTYTYGFNAKQLQFGGYVGHDYQFKKNNFQSTLALVEQRYSGKTDRRFAYLQHNNTIAGNLSFFGSAEIDMYRIVYDTIENTPEVKKDNNPRLSNLYVSLRYRIFKPLSVSVSYSARENIIYYETYKDIVARLLESETNKGYQFQLNYRPWSKLTIGATAGYRFQKNDPRDSKNLYSYIMYNDVPWIHVSATLSATLLESAYLKGNIYSLGFDRDLISGKLSANLGYRYVDYMFSNTEEHMLQHMAEAGLNWRILKKLNLSLHYEGTLEPDYMYNMVYVNLSRSF